MSRCVEQRVRACGAASAGARAEQLCGHPGHLQHPLFGRVIHLGARVLDHRGSLGGGRQVLGVREGGQGQESERVEHLRERER